MAGRLPGLVLGELSEREAAEVRAHAAQCDRCRAELSQFEEILACADRRKDLSMDGARYASAQDGLLAEVGNTGKANSNVRLLLRPAFASRKIMTSTVAKIGVAAVVAVGVGILGLSKVGRTPSERGSVFRGFPLLAKACAAEESLFLGGDLIHIQNEIIVCGRGSATPSEGLDHTWLPMCSMKPDGTLRFDQLKFSIEPESYVVTDHSWYDPVTGRFARVLKTDGTVFFANLYDGRSVYASSSAADGTLTLTEEAVVEPFAPPQSPAEYLGLAAGLKASLAQDNAQVRSVEEGTLDDGAPAHVYKVGTPDPNGNLHAWWLFKVRDEDSTIAEKEFVVSGQARMLIRRVVTEPVEAPGVSWDLDEIEALLAKPGADRRVSVTPDMVIPRVSVQHMVERADFETYVFKTRPAWTGDVEITDCFDPASPGGRMFIMTARAVDGRHLVLVQSPTYNKMLGNVVKQGDVVYTSPNGFKVWGGGPQKWFAQLLLQSARASIKDPPSAERIGYALESPAGTFPALAVNGPVSDEELHRLVDSLIPAERYLAHQVQER
jgi:hypothetical protein